MKYLITILFSFSAFCTEYDYQKIADQLLTHKLKNDLEFDWTDALLGLAIVRSQDNLKIRPNLIRKVMKFYRNNEKAPVNITSPDLLASVMGAIEFEKFDHLFKKTVQSGYRFLISEPKNKIGALNHVGSRHQFASFLPLTRFFVDDSIWADSTVMYVIPAMMIGKKFRDQKLINFANSQLAIFEKYLKDSNGLYKHAYFLEDKSVYPEGDYYWLRGNAWIIYSLVEMYELTSNKTKKKEYQIQLVSIFNSLIKMQKENGLFDTILSDKDIYNYEDSAGNALILYALLKAQRLEIFKTQNITEKLFKGLFNKIAFHNKYRASFTGISGPTNAFKYYWYYTWLVGMQANLGYGLGPFIMALNELELAKNN